jgi:hypothetical protein
VSRDEGSYQDLAPLDSGGSGDSGGPGDSGRDGDAAAGRGERGSARVEDLPPPLVPRGAGELLDLGLEILRDRFALIVGTCVILWIPARALEPLIGSNAWFADPNADTGTQEALLALGGLMVTAFVQILVQALASALVARLVYETLHGRRLMLRAALGEALRCVVGLIVIALITGLATTIGCCFFFVPFVYLHWKFSIAPSIYVLEPGGISNAITRTFALTSGSFLRWLAIITVVFFLTIPFSGLVAVQPQARAIVIDRLAVSGPVFDALMIVLSAIFMGLATAIASVSMTLLYLDCRVRHDGYDLRLALEELRARSTPARVSGGEPA